MLRVSKEDYEPFLNWLQQVSGKSWVNIDQERQQIMSQITQRRGEAFYVATRSGEFLVLPIDMHGETELYFFRGDVKPRNLAHILPVTEAWSDNKCVDEAAPIYRDCGKEPCPLDAILLPIVTYRVIAPEGTAEQGTPVASDCQKLEQQRPSLPTNDTGRTTLRRRD